MSNGFDKRINESFNKYLNTLQESSELNEAVPRDLMRQIKRTRDFEREKNYRRNPVHINGASNIEYINDYQNSNPQELTSNDVMKMKKNGEDLSDIYVLKNGELIKLDRYGHPDEFGSSTSYFRANQSLKTTLDGADKIYKGNIQKFKDTQPEKFRDRIGDPEGEIDSGHDYYDSPTGVKHGKDWNSRTERQANFNLGAARSSFDSDVRNANSYKQDVYRAQRERMRIKNLYNDGEISRKEMEQKLQRIYEPSLDSWDGHAWSRLKAERAADRYNASNKSNNVILYDVAKGNLADAQSRLEDSQEKLNKIKNDTASGYGYGENARIKGRVKDTQEKINELQQQLDYYNNLLAEYNDELQKNPVSKDIERFENAVAKYQSRINKNQTDIDKLLRRTSNESLTRKSNKNLNESLNWFNINDIIEEFKNYEYAVNIEEPYIKFNKVVDGIRTDLAYIPDIDYNNSISYEMYDVDEDKEIIKGTKSLSDTNYLYEIKELCDTLYNEFIEYCEEYNQPHN